MSLEDVASRANVSAGHVSRWELGTRNLDFSDYVKLCEILGVLPGDLLDHTAGVPLRFQSLVAMLEDRSDVELKRVVNVIAAMFGNVGDVTEIGDGNGVNSVQTYTQRKVYEDQPGIVAEAAPPINVPNRTHDKNDPGDKKKEQRSRRRSSYDVRGHK